MGTFFVGGVAINRDPTMNESRSCNYDNICVYMYICVILLGISLRLTRAYTHTMMIML